jgi:hypothetical protein
MTSTTHIPLNKLVAWNGNVRKTAGSDTGLAELAASIAAHGLINNLVVLPEKNGVHAVVTGGRRLAAHQILVKTGQAAGGSSRQMRGPSRCRQRPRNLPRRERRARGHAPRR